MLAVAVWHVATCILSCVCTCVLQVGEGEKLVKALFAMARELQPSVIFLGQCVQQSDKCRESVLLGGNKHFTYQVC